MADNSSLPPLPPGWAEHVAPTGHVYYYNAASKESTYKRPTLSVPIPPPRVDIPPPPPVSAPVPAPYLNLSDPRVANAFMAQHSQIPSRAKDFKHDGHRPHSERRPPPRQPPDKPVSKTAIPGCEPWVLVYTKLGRRFAYNPIKNASYWRIPDKLKPAILELDRAHILQKARASDALSSEDASKRPASSTEGKGSVSEKPLPEKTSTVPNGSAPDVNEDDSEYEEVEVTDDGEDDEDEDGENPSKRQKMEDSYAGGFTEFGEDDIAFQLQAAAEGFDEAYMDNDWEGAGEDADSSGEDATALFGALLADFNISPYSSWEKIMEEGKIFDDPRYTALTTMKARKAVWEAWSRERIKELKEQKASEEKKDPLVSYLDLLQKHASPRLYWPEFKRKYRKEAIMKDLSLSEKEKEKWYRDYVGRLKLPQATLKSDFTKLLNSIPAYEVKGKALPKKILTDIRYVCLDAKVRDPLVEAYLQ